jgi:hypothetical protein
MGADLSYLQVLVYILHKTGFSTAGFTTDPENVLFIAQPVDKFMLLVIIGTRRWIEYPKIGVTKVSHASYDHVASLIHLWESQRIQEAHSKGILILLLEQYRLCMTLVSCVLKDEVLSGKAFYNVAFALLDSARKSD